MKQRIISACIAIPLFISLILFAPMWLFKLFWLLTIAVVAYEMGKMFEFSKDFMKLLAYVGGNVFLCAFALFILSIETLELLNSVILWLCALLWLFVIPYILKIYDAQKAFSLKYQACLAMLCALFNMGFVIAVLRVHQTFGGKGLLGLLILIWASDAGAYFTGKKIGKTRFSPQISPNKTWEGFLGGIALAIFCSLLWLFCFSEQPLLYSMGTKLFFILTSLIALIYAALGDLYESMLKRHAGIKDSGRIMPGHGGAYDRIDSWLPAMVIWAVMIELLRLF